MSSKEEKSIRLSDALRENLRKRKKAIKNRDSSSKNIPVSSEKKQSDS